MTPHRVLLADDHALFREGLAGDRGRQTPTGQARIMLHQ